MKPTFIHPHFFSGSWIAAGAVAFLYVSTTVLRATPASPAPPAAPAVKSFATPQQAADALVNAAERFDIPALTQLFGPAIDDIVQAGEPALGRQRASDFVAKVREKQKISLDPKNKARAFLLVGNEDWPFPVPIVKRANRWSFDAAAGRQELLYRRVGANELDAITVCRGYVEAQDEYALRSRERHGVSQYAQQIISTPGKQDGLAWQNADGTWGGPIGEPIARAIAQGYKKGEPYHGYVFKILTGQGPAAPLGQLDYVVKGIMIGGFALAAAPAEYGVTGVQTFIVSNDGVVYQKDLGPTTREQFAKMERFNPDKSWTPVQEE